MFVPDAFVQVRLNVSVDRVTYIIKFWGYTFVDSPFILSFFYIIFIS